MPRDTSSSRGNLTSQVVHNGFFASATRKSVKKKPGERHKVQTSNWQREAWRMFDTVGEFHSACTWISNMISKAKLELYYEGALIAPGDAKHEAALRAIDSLFGGPEEQPEMLRLFGLHLSVAGDCYLIATSGGEDEDDDWEIYSNLVVLPDGEWYKLEDENEPLPTSSLVMRLWRKHPLERKKGDSNTRAALPVLSELETMTQRVAADSESRLTGAGLLLLPNEVTFPTMQREATEGDGDDAVVTRTGVDGFMDMLFDVASIAIADQSAASAKIPVAVQMPGEHIKNVRLINFWSEYDKALTELRNEAIRRLSLALDMPPEVLTGMADANHWTAWQMEEAAIKVHTEPLLKLIVSSLNEGYLWPYLDDEDMDEDEIRKYSFHADTSEMRLRPNRSKEAIELYDRAELNGEALRRENGFKPEDAMDDQERAAWIVRRIAQGSPNPELVAAAVAAMGADLDQFLQIMAPVDGQEPDKALGEKPLQRSLEEHPTHDIPDTQDDAIAAASEVVVLRVLERAGNRLKNRMGPNKPAGVAAMNLYQFTPLKQGDLDDLLEDAWGLCDEISTPVPRDQLNAYVRNLMLNGVAHDPVVMRRFLALARYTGVAAA